MIKTLSELVATTQTNVPLWLYDYVMENKQGMADTLRKTGRYSIPMPNGGEILIEANHAV